MSELRDLKWFYLIMGINTVIAIVYFILKLVLSHGKSKKSFVIKTLTMFLCPVLGPVYFGGSYLIYRIFFHKEVDLSDVIFNKERVESRVTAEEDRERNLASIEEAVNVTDKMNLRSLMMNIVREDVSKSLNAISVAMNAQDSETAHYAASVLQEVLNDFRTHVQKTYRQIMEEDEEGLGSEEKREVRRTLSKELIGYICDILEQRVFTEVEQHSLALTMDEVCEQLYDDDPCNIDADTYKSVSDNLLEVGEFDKCESWCNRLREAYPDTLASYVCRLKLYFKNQDREKFEMAMEELKQSDIVIDRETLELIRAFM